MARDEIVLLLLVIDLLNSLLSLYLLTQQFNQQNIQMYFWSYVALVRRGTRQGYCLDRVSIFLDISGHISYFNDILRYNY